MAESKQAKAKRLQGYNPKPIHQICANCAFLQDVKDLPWYHPGPATTKPTWCGKGDFEVEIEASCDKHEFPF